MVQQGNHAILRRKQVQARSGYGRSTIYLRIAQGLWPKPVHLGGRMVGWPEHEVTAVIAARIAGMSDNEVKMLVARLERERVSACAIVPVTSSNTERGRDNSHTGSSSKKLGR